MASSKSLQKVTHSEQWWANHAPDHLMRCTAHLKQDGSQCRRAAHPGTNVCSNHGALIPAVQAAASRRIGMSVDDAVKRLHGMLDDPQVEAREKIRILHDLLDRGGLGATSKHLVGVVTEDPVEALFRSLAADPNATYDPAEIEPPEPKVPDPVQAALDAEDGSDWESIVDAEVVDGDDPTPATDAVTDSPPPHIRKALETLI